MDKLRIRAPLILQTVLGFDAATIASAFLVSPATMSQRLVRAKSKIREAGIPFRVPDRSEIGERLESVLEAIYATFGEGWSDPAGSDLTRRDLAEEGIWLGRLLTAAMPDEPEALGLLAMMLYAEARSGAAAERRLCAAVGSGSHAMGPRHDRRGGEFAAAREWHGRNGALSARGGVAIGPCRAAPLRAIGLGGN
jgi:hypothetical protein